MNRYSGFRHLSSTLKSFMMLIRLKAVLLSLHAANSYILLTANLEDVHALAKQIAASPVANQLNKIIRRASSIFNQQYSKPGGPSSPKIQLRSDPTKDQVAADDDGEGDNFEVWKPDANDANLRAKASSESEPEASEISAESNDINPEQSKRRQNMQRNLPVGPDQIERRHLVGTDQIDKRHQVGPDLVELGKNASFYLKSIKKIFENV